MAFLDSVVFPRQNVSKPSISLRKSTFLNSIRMPGDKVSAFGQVAYQAKRDADVASTPLTLARETLTSPIKTAISGAKRGFTSYEGQPKSFRASDQIQGFREGGKMFLDILNDTGNRLIKTGEAVTGGASPSELAIRTGESTIGLINLAFSPISAALTALSPQPGIGNAADLVNKVMSAIFEGAADVAENSARELPVSEQTKERIMPLIREAAGTISLFGTGKAGHVAYSKAKARVAEATKEIAKDIEVQLKVASEPRPATRLKITTPATRHTEYARSMGYEPYIPVEQLPIIRFGTRPKTTEPVVRVPKESLELPRIPGTRLEPIRSRISEMLTTGREVPIPTAKTLAKELPKEYAKQRIMGQAPEVTKSLAERITPPAAEVPIQKPIGGGEIKESRLAAGVEELAVEKRLTEGFDGIPEYAQVSMRQQAQMAQEFLTKEPERAMKVALGEEMAPTGVIPEAIFIAIENRALRLGDIETLQRLATGSDLSLQATAMGQRIRTLGEREQLSPSRLISDVRKVREEAYEKKTGKKVAKAKQEEVAKIKETMKKESSKRQDWSEFIKSLECGY